jgi:MFS family permease
VTTPSQASYGTLFGIAEFRVLSSGTLLQIGAQTLLSVALSVAVYQSTGSPLLAAMALAAGFLPNAVGATALISIADRGRPRRVLAVLEVTRAALAVGLATDRVPVWLMLVLVVTAGLGTPVSSAVRWGLLPDLLVGDAYVLGRSVMTMLAAGAQIVGLGAGSVILAVLQPRGAFLAVAAASLLAAVIYRAGLTDRTPRGRTAASTIGQTWHVNRQLFRTPVVRGLILVQWLPMVLVAGAEGLFVPYATARGAPSAAAVLFGAAAGGMLIGDLVVARFISPPRRERLALPLAILLSVPYLLFALQPPIWFAVAFVATANVGAAYQLGVQRRYLDVLPDTTRGQGLGLIPTGNMALQGVTMAMAGLVAEWLPLAAVMAGFGALAVASVLVLSRHLMPSRWPLPVG